MSTTGSPMKIRAQRLMDELVTVNTLHDDLLAHIEAREDDKEPSDVEGEQLANYRSRAAGIKQELENLGDALEVEEQSAATSKRVRAHLAGRDAGVTVEGDQVKYRTFAVYARDRLITKWDDIAELAGGNEVRQAARERLARAPQHTLSEDIPGLLPPQHIDQIMDVINKSRPIVATSKSSTLTKGKITYPRITQRPTVELQSTEKTEGGTAEMKVEMVDVNAVTYIGGGNLSWQVVSWSTPDALALWFDLAAESYASKTEAKAASVLGSAAAAGGTASPLIAGTSTFPQVVAAIASGASKVYANSGAMADSLYVSPDVYFYLAGLTSDQGAKLISEGGLSLNTLGGSIGGIRVVVSPGLAAGRAYVGDSSAFIVAENAGAPVQLRAVEPAIGGYEVGLIGAFAAAAFTDSRFAKVGTG